VSVFTKIEAWDSTRRALFSLLIRGSSGAPCSVGVALGWRFIALRAQHQSAGERGGWLKEVMLGGAAPPQHHEALACSFDAACYRLLVNRPAPLRRRVTLRRRVMRAGGGYLSCSATLAAPDLFLSLGRIVAFPWMCFLYSAPYLLGSSALQTADQFSPKSCSPTSYGVGVDGG
jgi:hypothetical protein